MRTWEYRNLRYVEYKNWPFFHLSCRMWDLWSLSKANVVILVLSTPNCVNKEEVRSIYQIILTWMAIDPRNITWMIEEQDELLSGATLIWKKVWTIGCRTLTSSLYSELIRRQRTGQYRLIAQANPYYDQWSGLAGLRNSGNDRSDFYSLEPKGAKGTELS